jgi:pimeloyl-ACP methyl ester carboxylesterase
MPTFAHDGIRFSYLDRGAGPPLVFQHGLGGDMSQAGRYEVDRRLICLECRGHGGSHPLGPEVRLGFGTFADDVLALLDHLELETVDLAGVSMGAGVAARLAAEHPQRVRRLVLVRPAWFDQPSPPNLQAFTAIAALLRTGHPKSALLSTDAYRDVVAQSRAAGDSLLAQFDRPYARERARVLERLPADAPLVGEAAWTAVAAPTLVIATQEDPLHPFPMAHAIATALGSALEEVTPKGVDEQRHDREVEAAIETLLATS